jgi:hypothetical protein
MFYFSRFSVEYLANGKHSSDSNAVSDKEKKLEEEIEGFVLVDPLSFSGKEVGRVGGEGIGGIGKEGDGNVAVNAQNHDEASDERKPIEAYHDISGSFLADGLIFQSIDIT